MAMAMVVGDGDGDGSLRLQGEGKGKQRRGRAMASRRCCRNVDMAAKEMRKRQEKRKTTDPEGDLTAQQARLIVRYSIVGRSTTLRTTVTRLARW